MGVVLNELENVHKDCSVPKYCSVPFLLDLQSYIRRVNENGP